MCKRWGVIIHPHLLPTQTLKTWDWLVVASYYLVAAIGASVVALSKRKR